MKIKKITWLFGTTLLAAMILFTACKDPNETGFGVLPEEDHIAAGYIDTFTVYASTIQVDSVLTQQAQYQLFGTYVDPEFGRLQTGFYTQFSIGNNVNFGDSTLALDSIVLYLTIDDSYGKWEDEQQLEIYEIDEAMPDDSLFSNDTLALKRSVELSNGYTVNFGDIGGITELAIPLDASLGNKFLTADPDSQLIDNASFREFFKGLYVTATPTNLFSREPGGIFYGNLESTASRLSMYYKDGGEEKIFDFQISSTTNRFHNVTRTESADKLFGSTLASGDLNPQYHFIQSGGLIKMFVKFPTLDILAANGINKAELILPVEKDFLGSNDRFEPPPTLFAYLAEDDSLTEASGDPFSSADFDTDNNQYAIRLTNYAMQVVNEKLDNFGLILIPSNRATTMNRVVLGGTGNPISAPVLKVTYTTLPGN